jgi:hypothetical protein
VWVLNVGHGKFGKNLQNYVDKKSNKENIRSPWKKSKI